MLKYTLPRGTVTEKVMSDIMQRSSGRYHGRAGHLSSWCAVDLAVGVVVTYLLLLDVCGLPTGMSSNYFFKDYL